jgi:hypothetical protein
VYVSAANETSVRTVAVPRGYRLAQQGFDASGRPVASVDKKAPKTGAVTVAGGGFTVAKPSPARRESPLLPRVAVVWATFGRNGDSRP